MADLEEKLASDAEYKGWCADKVPQGYAEGHKAHDTSFGEK